YIPATVFERSDFSSHQISSKGVALIRNWLMTRHPAPARLVQSEDNRVGAGLLPHTCPQR
ncbi:MAG: hypothetical protein DMG69_23515, partial [Acidobacteria bacterium]